MAWPAPWPWCGSGACAASPASTTRPRLHRRRPATVNPSHVLALNAPPPRRGTPHRRMCIRDRTCAPGSRPQSPCGTSACPKRKSAAPPRRSFPSYRWGIQLHSTPRTSRRCCGPPGPGLKKSRTRTGDSTDSQHQQRKRQLGRPQQRTDITLLLKENASNCPI